MNIDKYDLICSLGGNCSTAHNLRFRNKRLYSLPFDWCYIENETPIEKLTECFQNNSFDLIAQQKNLVLIPQKEETMFHSNTIHYKDSWSNYYFINHFSKPIEDGSYTDFEKKFKKRIKRLLFKIEKSQNILFILGTNFEFDKTVLLRLQEVLRYKYPNKNIKFELIEFNCQTESITNENEFFTVRKYKRSQNLYDFTKSNFEWQFLDDIKVKNTKIINILRMNRGVKIQILPSISAIFRIKLFLLDLRFDFLLGKEKE